MIGEAGSIIEPLYDIADMSFGMVPFLFPLFVMINTQFRALIDFKKKGHQKIEILSTVGEVQTSVSRFQS